MTHRLFRPIWQRGGSWLSAAEMLKRSADNLLVDYQAAYQQLDEQRSRAIAHGTILDLETLPPDLDLYCPYMLLMGYAVENLIKGIIVCGTGITDPNFDGKIDFGDFRAINRDNGGPWSIDKHGFLTLFKATIIREDLFTEDEKKVLQYLDKIVLWGGRYPVAKKQDPNRPIDIVCAEPPFIGTPTVLPIPTVNNIYIKALEELHRICTQYGH